MMAGRYRVAVGIWGVSPSDFWAMTPQEWWWIHDAKDAGAKPGGSLTEAELAELYQEFEK